MRAQFATGSGFPTARRSSPTATAARARRPRSRSSGSSDSRRATIAARGTSGRGPSCRSSSAPTRLGGSEEGAAEAPAELVPALDLRLDLGLELRKRAWEGVLAVELPPLDDLSEAG